MPFFREKYLPFTLDDAIAMLKDQTYSEVEAALRISKSTLIREIRRREANKQMQK